MKVDQVTEVFYVIESDIFNTVLESCCKDSTIGFFWAFCGTIFTNINGNHVRSVE